MELKFSDLVKTTDNELKNELDSCIATNPQAVLDHSADILTAMVAYMAKDIANPREKDIEENWERLSKTLLAQIKTKYCVVALFNATARHLDHLC